MIKDSRDTRNHVLCDDIQTQYNISQVRLQLEMMIASLFGGGRSWRGDKAGFWGSDNVLFLTPLIPWGSSVCELSNYMLISLYVHYTDNRVKIYLYPNLI